ncbi:MAG: hypothetical protein CMLOHMNK_00156 [Steroidobacteraceae bacterium]|nr:hypothetical protein [Steroidobacteraceae bacterium]
MAEMLVVLMALVPLWLALLAYAGLQDLAATTQAAARYAAFDAARSPQAVASLAQRIRAHIFDDSVAPVASAGRANGDAWSRYPGLWIDPATRTNWLGSPASVSAQVTTRPLGGVAGGASRAALAAVAPAAPLAPGRFDLRPTGVSLARVRSELAPVSLPWLSRPFVLEARVGVLGDAWAADDARETARRVRGASPLRVLAPVTALIVPLTPALGLLEPRLREFCPGEVAPDIVPPDRLRPRPLVARREYLRC